ncbi:DUF4267 domain-containing protein [Sphingomonas sp. ID1715]|uniref:DUF4267 domain-containing protein n=1 Tax=Sphingomonas sp. ID1715 TaxID=1656898 RepID=UPI001489299F|nr:DUF4267 domain-containing protein [Sphingomonas sp. ID1715]NNM78319.1 DUF4267 domain-containing protein [Sphingomonas sp. ID1715]
MAFKYGKDSSLTGADALVRGIGLFSLGLGVAELVAPGKIARTFGLEGKEGLLRAYGAREIASGIGTLSTDPQPALWSRVAGDVLDMATLALGTRSGKEDAKRNAMLGIGAVAGIAALDAFAATLMGRRGGERPPPADYSDRSGLPKGVEASRGYYRQRKERGPAVAQQDAREDRRHSGGSSAGSTSPAPERTETDTGQAPIAPSVALS